MLHSQTSISATLENQLHHLSCQILYLVLAHFWPIDSAAIHFVIAYDTTMTVRTYFRFRSIFRRDDKSSTVTVAPRVERHYKYTVVLGSKAHSYSQNHVDKNNIARFNYLFAGQTVARLRRNNGFISHTNTSYSHHNCRINCHNGFRQGLYRNYNYVTEYTPSNVPIG